MIFNIYYVNFSKVYEIKMMLSNIISLGGEFNKEIAKGAESEIRTQLGAKFLNFFGGEIEGKGKTTGSDSQKVLQTFEIKTTKSIILNEVIDKSINLDNLTDIEEGSLIKIDNVKLSLENETELRTVKLFATDSFKGMAVPGANGIDLNNLMNSLIKDYAYKIRGKVVDKDIEIIVKIPFTFESEFESSYNIDDLFIGKVSIIGLYKGKLKLDSLKNSLDFFKELGNSQNNNNSTQEIQDSQYTESVPLSNQSQSDKEYHYIDLLAIIQNINIPIKK